MTDPVPHHYDFIRSRNFWGVPALVKIPCYALDRNSYNIFFRNIYKFRFLRHINRIVPLAGRFNIQTFKCCIPWHLTIHVRINRLIFSYRLRYRISIKKGAPLYIYSSHIISLLIFTFGVFIPD